MKVTIKQPDLSKWIDTVNDLTVEVGTAIQETAVQNAPRKTGVYQRSIEYDGNVTVTANANYSADIEYGTNAHEIRPVTTQALHFKQNGKDVFYKKSDKIAVKIIKIVGYLFMLLLVCKQENLHKIKMRNIRSCK